MYEDLYLYYKFQKSSCKNMILLNLNNDFLIPTCSKIQLSTIKCQEMLNTYISLKIKLILYDTNFKKFIIFIVLYTER